METGDREARLMRRAFRDGLNPVRWHLDGDSAQGLFLKGGPELGVQAETGERTWFRLPIKIVRLHVEPRPTGGDTFSADPMAWREALVVTLECENRIGRVVYLNDPDNDPRAL